MTHDAHNLNEYEGCYAGCCHDAIIKKLSRTNNPQTSKDAAKKMVDSGELNKQEKMVYEAIKGYSSHANHNSKYKDFTTKDIARWMSDYYYGKAYDICRRRFSGLFNKFKICLTGDRRNGCRVWRLL